MPTTHLTPCDDGPARPRVQARVMKRVVEYSKLLFDKDETFRVETDGPWDVNVYCNYSTVGSFPVISVFDIHHLADRFTDAEKESAVTYSATMSMGGADAVAMTVIRRIADLCNTAADQNDSLSHIRVSDEEIEAKGLTPPASYW